MKLRYPFYQESLFQDQPYASMILMAPYCDFNCQGCQNSPLGEQSIRNFSVDQLFKAYTENVFVDGITVGGLEVSLSGEAFFNDLHRLIKAASVPKITIYTRFTKEDPNISRLLRLLDLDCVEELYLKTGGYISGLKSRQEDLYQPETKRIWSIKLASRNQRFEVIKGVWKNGSKISQYLNGAASNNAY